MPLDTALYTVWVPELADSGRIYTAAEAIDISNISPIKTEKIQTLEIGFKGFLSERIHATVDFYTSFYEDFFSVINNWDFSNITIYDSFYEHLKFMLFIK